MLGADSSVRRHPQGMANGVGLESISNDGGSGTRAERTAAGLISFLRAEGAARKGHAGGRTLLDHLVGTYDIVGRWNQPAWLQHAALIHSVYGTDLYRERLLPVSRRDDVIRIAGDQAERIAYLFCITPRELLFGGTHLWARDLPTLPLDREREPNDQPRATRAEQDGLVLLHMANLAEQARAADGSPGRWLVRLRELAELLIDSDALTLPLFIAELAAFSEADESLSRRTYRAAVSQADDLEAMASRLALTAAVCPVVAEPCVWQAHLSHSRGDRSAARWWAACARRRLLDLGTAWDKRLTFDEWLQLAELLDLPPDREIPASAAPITDPRTLFEAVVSGCVDQDSGPGGAAVVQQPISPPDSATGGKRFHRYIDMLSDADGPGPRGLYPDLQSQPWYDGQDFPLAVYLESHYEAIRDEILGLEPAKFHRESERIKRSGDWDVAFFYERGRRCADICDACPVTTRGIESYPAMRTIAGLIYVSRMRAGTHIRAHRGPTNLRVRCHLGIKVPGGDCAIRVGDEARPWHEGRCLVFDDFFEHEAWNHTEEDRIVLIVDLWHPGLSATEVRSLEGLQAYTYAHAQQVNRYWSSNAAAKRKLAGGGSEPNRSN